MTDPLCAQSHTGIHQFILANVTDYIFPEYFEYAPCIRERISSELYCNGEYDKLIASVEHESNSTDLCCNHHGFKECLVSQSVSCCGPQCGRASEASDYARMFLDKALGFVAQECNRAG